MRKSKEDPKLSKVINFIKSGGVNKNVDLYNSLLDTLTHGCDHYLLHQDFSSCNIQLLLFFFLILKNLFF